MMPPENGARASDSPGGCYGYEKDFRTALPQLLAVGAKNLLLLAYGMTLGFVTILIPAVKDPTNTDEVIHLGPEEISWIGSLNLIIVPFGCALSGTVTNPLGRRRSMQLVNIPFAIAWLVLFCAQSSTYLYVALGLTGLAGGLLEAPVLTYVAEVTQPHLRGFLTATSSMTIIVGVFTQFLFGLILYWRMVTLVNILFTLSALIGLFFIPESPHWLVSRNRIEEATKSLQWLRGWTTPEVVQAELADIKKLYATKSGMDANELGSEESWLETLLRYSKPSFLKPYFLVSFAFFVGHFSGMTSLQTYALEIFQRLRTPIDRYFATLILGVVQIIGSLTCVILVHYTGKRPLTLISLVGTALCCVTVAGYDVYITSMSEELPGGPFKNATETNFATVPMHEQKDSYAWVPMTSLMLLACLSHVGIRLLPWILIGEVFSAKTRSGASGVSSATGYVFAFLSNKFFTSMLDTMFIRGTYGFYAITSITGAIVMYFILPETEGKKLIEIENHFEGIKMLTNKVYHSKRIKRGTSEKNPTHACDKNLEMSPVKKEDLSITTCENHAINEKSNDSNLDTHDNLAFETDFEHGKQISETTQL